MCICYMAITIYLGFYYDYYYVYYYNTIHAIIAHCIILSIVVMLHKTFHMITQNCIVFSHIYFWLKYKIKGLKVSFLLCTPVRPVRANE